MVAQISRRKHGLIPPYSRAQISSWVALVLSLVEFVVFVSPILPIAASIPVTIAFTAVVAAVVYVATMTMIVDPIDVHLAHALNENKETNHGDADLPNEAMKHCWICDTQVAEHSMHCKFCNKCVYHFDHHCLWLNTCVGTANYSYFFSTLLSLLALEMVHLTIQLVLVIDIYVHGPTYARAKDWFHVDNALPVSIVLTFFVVFNIVSLLMVGQLLWFHLGLQREKLTTYQYIVRESKQKRDKSKREQELEAKRLVAMDEYRRSQQTFQAERLRLGGWCRELGCAALDPLKLPPPPREPDPEAGFAAILGPSSETTNGNHVGNGAGHSGGGGRVEESRHRDENDVVLESSSSIANGSTS